MNCHICKDPLRDAGVPTLWWYKITRVPVGENRLGPESVAVCESCVTQYNPVEMLEMES